MQAATATNDQLKATARGQAGRLHGKTYWYAMGLGALGLLIAINQTFSLHILGFDPLGNAFLYYLIGIYLAAAYLIYPLSKKQGDYVPWYALGPCGVGDRLNHLPCPARPDHHRARLAFQRADRGDADLRRCCCC